MNKRIYFFIGTTAELIKLAPVIKEVNKKKLDLKIISSGQGELLSNEFSGFLNHFKVDISFKKKSKKSSVLLFVLWTFRTLFAALFSLNKEFKNLDRKEYYFIVHGDTVSSLIGTIIAKIYGFKLVHIESGLRSFNFLEPFPEEISRFIISKFADIHFCPNKWCLENLHYSKGLKINTYQNTLIESFWWAFKQKRKMANFRKPKGKYFVLIMHRQEHIIFDKKNTKWIIKYILSNSKKDLSCIIMNYATTLNFLKKTGLDFNNMNRKIYLTPRQKYKDFIRLISNAEYICTDGGSNQEEMYYMGKPCLILRRFTERKEGLGKNVVLSELSTKKIKEFLNNYKNYTRNEIRFHKRPSEIIIDYLLKLK